MRESNGSETNDFIWFGTTTSRKIADLFDWRSLVRAQTAL
jgi:hypothetical protein